jgi:hypothetical protein
MVHNSGKQRWAMLQARGMNRKQLSRANTLSAKIVHMIVRDARLTLCSLANLAAMDVGTSPS